MVHPHQPFLLWLSNRSISCLCVSASSNLMTQLFCRRLTEMKAKGLWGEVCRRRREVYGVRVEQKMSIVINSKCLVCIFFYLPSCVRLGIFGVLVCMWCKRSINNSAAVSVSSAAAPLLTGITPQDTLEWAGEQGRERERHKRRWKENIKRAWMMRCHGSKRAWISEKC